jgi:hypothetical protein
MSQVSQSLLWAAVAVAQEAVPVGVHQIGRIPMAVVDKVEMLFLTHCQSLPGKFMKLLFRQVVQADYQAMFTVVLYMLFRSQGTMAATQW